MVPPQQPMGQREAPGMSAMGQREAPGFPEAPGMSEPPGAMEDLAGWTLPSGARRAIAKFKEFLPEGTLNNAKQRLAVLAAVMDQMGVDIQTFQLAVPKIRQAMTIDAKRLQEPMPDRQQLRK